MYARSTTFQGKPENIDAGIKFVKTEAAPVMYRVDGFRGLSLLVDRQTGECIATSSWESESAMRDSDKHLRPIRDRGRDVLGGSMQIDAWEIVVLHRTHHGKCCRVSWLKGDVEAMIGTFRVSIIPQLERTPGFCSASLLVDRSSDLGCATTAWENQSAMESSRLAADEMRSRLASDSAGDVVRVQEFDLAHSHLHVPEMV
jgi:heme-degrading monooxygenase HmoA